MHFSQISVSDLILVDEDGNVVIGDEPVNGAAFAIHSAIHKARPNVHVRFMKNNVLDNLPTVTDLSMLQ